MRVRAALAAAGLALLTAFAGAAPAAAAEPELTVTGSEPQVGEKLTFSLEGWPAGTVHAELCGNEAARGSTDCATSSAVQFYVPASGKATGRLTVVAPPVACPCVLRVTTLGPAPTTRTVPVALKGVTAEAPAETAPGRLRVAELEVVSTGGRAALLGLADEMVVRVGLRNEGTAEVGDATMHLLTGRPGRAGEVVPAPQLGVIAPGQTREYLIRVPVGAPVFGAVFALELTVFVPIFFATPLIWIVGDLPGIL